MKVNYIFGAAALLALMSVVGCGKRDGLKELSSGRVAFELNDLKKAERFFTKSVQLAPANVDAHLYLARVKLALGELEAANSEVEAAVSLEPSATDVMLLEAEIAYHLKDYAKAAQRYQAIADDKDSAESVRAQAWSGLGVVEFTCDHYHLARIAFLRALQIDRRSASARYHLGLLYRDGFGYVEAALEQFEIYVRLEASANVRVQKVLRTVIPELKEQLAQTAAERPGASKRNSAAAATAISKAEGQLKKGTYKLARSQYEEALKADPLSYPAALGLAKVWPRVDASRNGQLKSLEYYHLACTLHPGSTATYLATGALALKLGMNAQAVEGYSRALAASPTSLEAIDGLIRALRKTGNKSRVAEAYQQYRNLLSSARSSRKS